MAKRVRQGPKVRSAQKRGVRRRDDSDNPELAPPEPLLAPNDDLGEELAEEYLISATSGEQAAEDIRNQETPEERGGPFVETTSAQEIDYEDDEPEDSEAEPFPTATRQEDQ
jgi:hypothetical protein